MASSSELPGRKAKRAQRLTHEQLGLFPTCTWDLETSNLAADIGFILSAAIKPWGGETKVFRIDESPDYDKDRSDDSWLVKQVRSELSKYTIAVGYFSTRFDHPYLNTRLLFYGEEIIPEDILHLDLWQIVKFRMKLMHSSLNSVIEHLNTKTQKTRVLGRVWTQAMTGNKKALDYIVDHNIKDVVSLEEVTAKLSKFMKLQYRFLR